MKRAFGSLCYLCIAVGNIEEMMKLAPLVFVVWTLLNGPALRADAPPGTIKEIAPGVWFREGDARGGSGHSNNIIIEMKDYLIIVDANYPSGARLVLSDTKKLSSKPIKYVINTHHHPDHMYGNHIFTEAGATTIAHVGAWE